VIYTDISRDGMLTGINIKATEELAKYSPFPVIASGGLSNEEEIFELARRGIHGCIIGKAFYEGLIDVKNVIEKLKNT